MGPVPQTVPVGEHPKLIASRLGHTSVRVVLDPYGHLFEGLDEAAAERLNGLVARPETDKSRTKRREAVVDLSHR